MSLEQSKPNRSQRLEPTRSQSISTVTLPDPSHPGPDSHTLNYTLKQQRLPDVDMGSGTKNQAPRFHPLPQRDSGQRDGSYLEERLLSGTRE